MFTKKSKEALIKQKLLSKLDPYNESVVVFNKRLAECVIKEYNIGGMNSDSEDSFDDDDFRFKDKKRAYQDEDLFDYKKQIGNSIANAIRLNGLGNQQ